MESIELDCPPGSTRPWDLIAGVVDGLGLELPAERPAAFFGCATWTFDVPRDEWVEKYQPTVKRRIEKLYNAGVIRYGSW